MRERDPHDGERDWLRANLPPGKLEVILYAGGRQIVGSLLNISHSGLLVACKPTPPVGTKLTLDVEMPDRAVTAKVRVVRISDDPPGVALHFEGVPLEDRLSIEALLERASTQL